MLELKPEQFGDELKQLGFVESELTGDETEEGGESQCWLLKSELTFLQASSDRFVCTPSHESDSILE